MSNTRIEEASPAQIPYSEAEWARIFEVGEHIDAALLKGDVRLSMGGEPTFVAADDPAAPEWNTAALGPTKRLFADRLARRLLKRFGPGGLLHYGQGKWYPGETTARWSFGVYWRTDGTPLWQDAALIDDESPRGARPAPDALTFTHELCRQLSVPPDAAIAAYEDAVHYLLIERKLPIGASPTESRLGTVEERARVARILKRGPGVPAGYVLPLRLQDGACQAERWAFRRDRLFLLPGDSPLGLRLPFGDTPEIGLLDHTDVSLTDPFAPSPEHPPTSDRPAPAKDPVRTALAIEPRQGRLGIFLPPLAHLADYARLLAAIERAAAVTGAAIHLEGYPPPDDRHVQSIRVTPDPGVLEINVHPARSWRELDAITTGVYEDATAIGLSAAKFRMDGRRIGTGGGSHIVVGGLTPADSPFLRRPDLLASVLAYWQTHPCLSYLFSGMFVGPTCQAPRVDEARPEAVHELQDALESLQAAETQLPPWLIDHTLRDLLVDVTGNRHRAEICIDKLYASDGVMGRLGLVEFRAFEMAPHPRMSLAMGLIVRALIAWFWRQPYRRPLARWGTGLHDAFMLPHVLWQDMEAVAADLQGAGFPVEAGWFRPHLEFRCPLIGTVAYAGVILELREALEPWLVLGNENASGGASRTVDSSLYRLQLRLSHRIGDRYRAACNGVLVPLAPTGTPGEYVGGVRFRAWQPMQGFHPTIPPHVPLTFDLVDTWTGRSVGGCRYHTWHPAGGSYEALPQNAREAEARCLARFERIGHTPGTATFLDPGTSPEAPLTLDLRRVAARGRRG